MDQTLDRQPVGVPMVLEPAANDLTKLFHNLLSSLHRQNGARVKANYQRDDAPSWLKFRKVFSGGGQPLWFVFVILPLLAKRGECRGEESQSFGSLICFKSGGTNRCSAAFFITLTQPDLC
jgi:hypothetical protein